MEPYVWQIALGAIIVALLSSIWPLYEVRKFDKRFGKPEDRES